MQSSDIFIIQTITELHIGCGSGLGLIDNPIMRHRRNNFPYIPSSSIKGVLKDYYYHRKASKVSAEDCKLIFGPDANNNGDEMASGLGILDAELLFFPVRSLAGIFGWITCPAVLQEFHYRLQKLSIEQKELKAFFEDSSYKTFCAQNDVKALYKMKALSTQAQSPLYYSPNKIMLEEYDIVSQECKAWKNFIDSISSVWNDNNIKEQFQRKALLLPDDDFTYFISHTTSVVPNIRIDSKTGVTEEGSLRYTEYLMELSLFHSAFIYQKIQDKEASYIQEKFLMRDGKKVIEPEIIQIGAGETLGKGLVALSLLEKKGNENAAK